jgi:hypothetical protein
MHVSLTEIIKKNIGEGFNNTYFEGISPNHGTIGVIPMSLRIHTICRTDVASSHLSKVCVKLKGTTRIGH